MLAGELIEMVLQNLSRILHLRSLLAMPYLQKKTFSEIPCSHACRIEFLHYLQHGQHLFLISLDICTERKVVDDAVYAPAEISVIIQASDYERSHGILMLGKVAVSQLLLQALGKAFLY